jgi:hypothetical protein
MHCRCGALFKVVPLLELKTRGDACGEKEEQEQDLHHSRLAPAYTPGIELVGPIMAPSNRARLMSV